MCSGLEGFGHHLNTDNFNTSVDLYQYFVENNIYDCGTIKGSKRNFPKDIVFEGTRGLARGTYQWRMCGLLLAAAARGAGEGGESGDVPFQPLLKDYKQLLDEVFVISRIIKVTVRLISLSRNITKTESNNFLIIH